MRKGVESMTNSNTAVVNILVPSPNMGVSELEIWPNVETRDHSIEKETGGLDREGR